MRACVYTITKNEEQFAERFMKACAGAACVVVLDTGSTDKTVEKFQQLGAVVHVQEFKPWRFDHARNRNLELIPTDIDVCLAIDADEILMPGWLEALKKVWKDGVTRVRYKYVWSWTDETTPGHWFYADKIHARHGYVWKHPVHEALYPINQGEKYATSEIVVEHRADNTKSRGSYLPLLELAVKEDPDDDRRSHYLAREYYFYKKHAEAEKEFLRHLSLPRAQWGAERAASCRYIAKVRQELKDENGRLKWLLQAVAECPSERDPWLDLAKCYYDRQDHLSTYWAAKCGLRITDRVVNYISTNEAWGEKLHDLVGVSAWYAGLKGESREHSITAWRMNPHDQRLASNVKMVRTLLGERPQIKLLWPTVRPAIFKERIKEWKDRAVEPSRINVEVAVNTLEQRMELSSLTVANSVIIVGDERRGVTHAAYELTKRVDGLPGDIVILASDDFHPPQGWDEWVLSQFNGFGGCLVVRDGEQLRNCVRIPIMDFSCLVALNRITYHPSYRHMWSDNELFDVLQEKGLLRDLRDSSPPFEHRHWFDGKRPGDDVDKLVLSWNKEDEQNYQIRLALPLKTKLTV
ncbi:MAG: glycosyltransferase [Candidatus Nanopelagicaceae bacterium]|nr:glycosyltransferase [Candidatus Nanopelagicaceae bacterium]